MCSSWSTCWRPSSWSIASRTDEDSSIVRVELEARPVDAELTARDARPAFKHTIGLASRPPSMHDDREREGVFIRVVEGEGCRWMRTSPADPTSGR